MAYPDDEIARIRDTFEDRDLDGARSGAFARASLRLADQRLERMDAIITGAFGPAHPRILDVGCGGGRDLAHWLSCGWPAGHLAGVDVVPDRVERARTSCPGVDIRLGASGPLPFPDAAFDVACASMVLSSILDDGVRRALCLEMLRVVRPGGLLLVYDFVIRNPRNPDVRPMPLRELVRDVGRAAQGSLRLSPLVYAVALGEAIHPRLGDLAMSVAPPTHRLTWWVSPGISAG
jgi:SAM-dependent methyltransferase